ncbi:MAG: histidine phosphatase family protein [Planctomycetota bacterium]|nr:MAG: histidine phosphatase family protein [Planctomycetota bacterium]
MRISPATASAAPSSPTRPASRRSCASNRATSPVRSAFPRARRATTVAVRLTTPSPAIGRLAGPRAEVWLVRHPEVHADWRARAYGSLDVPLSEHGLAQAREIGAAYARLAPRAVIASPLVRARTLAECIASGAGVALELDAALRELDRGRWQGRERAELEREAPAEVAAYHDDPWNYRAHGGETDADIAARAQPVLERAVAGEPDRAAVVLVTHYNVIRVLCALALGLEPARSFALRVDPCRGILLARGSHGWSLARSNVLAP